MIFDQKKCVSKKKKGLHPKKSEKRHDFIKKVEKDMILLKIQGGISAHLSELANFFPKKTWIFFKKMTRPYNSEKARGHLRTPVWPRWFFFQKDMIL